MQHMEWRWTKYLTQLTTQILSEHKFTHEKNHMLKKKPDAKALPPRKPILKII